MIVLRDYRASDFEAVWQLDQSCFEEGIAYSREELKFYLKRRGAFALVAHEGENVAAFALCETDKRGFAHVITIDVGKEFRRGGLGTQLMQQTEARALERGSKAIVLEVAVDNAAAIRFYRKHGYKVLKTIPKYYLGYLDALLMGKKLGAAAQTAAAPDAE